LRRRALAIGPSDQFATNDVVVAVDEDDSPLPHALKGIYMAKLRLGYLLVSTALTVVAFTATSVRAAPDARAVLAAAIPAPEPADMRPLTPADIKQAPGAKAATPSAAPAVTAPETTEQKAVEVIPTDPIAIKIKEVLASKSGMFAGKKDRAAAEAFYAARTYAPIWESASGAINERAKAAIAYLGTIDSEGLDPGEYSIPNFKTATTPDQAAEADVRLTAALLTYARHAQNGRVNPSRIVREVAYNAEPLDAAEALAKIADAKDVAATLASFNPQYPQYKALKAKLAELRGGKSGSGAVRIPSGPVLKVGKTAVHDARVPALRERLKVEAKDDEVYDRQLADAVAAFQKEHELKGNGDLTTATVDALNGPRRDRSHEIDIIIANMERWRWLGHDVSKAYSMLNIPDFTLKVYKNQNVIWQTRVVVGKTSTPTPLLTETMKFITVNPTWNVPPSIVHNEYLPALRQDPTVLARYGLRVSYNRDGSVHISQPPGDRNALGRIRFNFPNKFLVYQHDTPDKNLFALSKRAFSHGCQRVQDPAKYAEVMSSLGLENSPYSQERIRQMIANGSEVNINFTTPIPVHLTYQTAFVDEAGKLQFRDDVYGRDAPVLALLKSNERAPADVAVAQKSEPSSSTSSSSTSSGRQRSRVANAQPSYNGGGGFFGWLSGRPPAAVPQRRNYYR
jgi:L,D-transpeptidase YcbB